MRRREFLQASVIGGVVGCITGLTGFFLAKREPCGVAVLFRYPVGHSRCIFVSGGDWENGDLIKLSGVQYTVIQQEHGWLEITECDEIIGYPCEDWKAQRLWLDRPLETDCPIGTEAIRMGHCHVPQV